MKVVDDVPAPGPYRRGTEVFDELSGRDSLPAVVRGKNRMNIGEATINIELSVNDKLVDDMLLGTALFGSHVRAISSKRRCFIMTQCGTTGILDDVNRKKDDDITARILKTMGVPLGFG